jgi:hypothetical protein
LRTFFEIRGDDPGLAYASRWAEVVNFIVLTLLRFAERGAEYRRISGALPPAAWETLPRK